jgi:pyruvate/2-oxoglutarate dehydrogenase complex dihydrolipoamide dehydrogenase (E3) component
MAKWDYDVIVIGAGAAGLTASTTAGACGAKVLLIEKESKLGGDCLHYGCVPSKSLIKSAHVSHLINNAVRYGLPTIKLPPVDFKQIRNRIKGVIETIQVHDSPEYIKKKYNVDTSFGPARFVSDHSIDLNGKKLTAKYFIVAAGSAPVIPPIEGLKEVPFLTNLNIFSLDELPESLIVLGGGPIGLEMAQSFSRLGSKVTVVEALGQLLPKEDPDVAAFVLEKLKGEGISVMLNTKAIRVRQEQGQIVVGVEAEGLIKHIKANKILVSVGRKPNLEGLNLEKAGVIFDKRGIKVDQRLRTNVKHIFACGDVSGPYQFTHVAGYQAGIAALHAVYPIIGALHLPIKANYKNIPWCTYIDPEVASIGLNETRAKELGISYHVHREEIKNNDRAKAEGELDGFIKLLINGSGRVIGVQIVSFRASDLVAEWIAVMNGKISLSTLGNAIHPYPSLSEINKTAALNHFLKSSTFLKLRMLLNI